MTLLLSKIQLNKVIGSNSIVIVSITLLFLMLNKLQMSCLLCPNFH